MSDFAHGSALEGDPPLTGLSGTGEYLSESKSRMGEGRRRWRVADWGRRWRGRHRGHFQSLCGMGNPS